MCEETISDGIIIGAVGGAIAGLVIWIADLCRKWILKYCDTKRVENWLKKNTKPNHSKEWRSTRVIASHNNLPEDRVNYICSYSKKIELNKKDGNESDEIWKYKE
ncbi:hypothetical protein EV195_11249 [Tenacibaculum skagerrakense]|uniref:Uncharacterized protein n=1 Tax=Tenacibaculum skagerrakense TaxID=186571 RepID=A0A4R2NLH8_9FLAO|nr:hypothetical protein [Tenacibaculum skagerrakense]TCP22400.1 hypothetical protein EV195_11249 [Tenacibaculum skagerrakense]